MKKITIVGLGALGSHAALGLRNAGQLRLVDFDHVEQKNTLSQFHTKMSLRKNKATALSQMMLGMWGVKCDVVPHKITEDNAKVILAGQDLVLDCTDNIAARTCIKTFCDQAGIPLLHGAMAADGKFAQAAWTEDFEADAESGDGATCENGENLQFHLLVGGALAVSAKLYLDKGLKHSVQATPGQVRRV